MLEELFSSNVRVQLLVILLTNPDEEFYIRQLARRTGEHPYAVQRELRRLERLGLLTSHTRGRMKYYSVERGFPLYPELKRIILKTAGLGDLVREGLQNLGSIEFAFIYGSIAAGEEDAASDIDLMLVGEIDLLALAPVIAGLEERLGRSINYVAHSSEEFKERKEQKDPFLEDVLRGPIVMLIGREDGLSGIGAERAD